MSPSSTRSLLAIALVSALAAHTVAPARAQSNNPFSLSTSAESVTLAPGQFTVSDIRVEGLQRIGAGTVFTYLPIERGDTVDGSHISQAIRALYRTGFFEDIRMDRQGSILVVTVVERPAINRLTITGNKDIKTEDLTRGLRDIGLSEGDTFDRLALDRVTQELTRQYNNRGKYNVRIEPSVTRLDRNRVDLTIAIDEGIAAKIRHINIVGAEAYSQEQLLDTWESSETNWLSWYRRDDQYSREKLAGDLERLSEFYLDRGHIDFSVDHTQVEISPDKSNMYITAGITEGDVYTLSEVKLAGDLVLPEEELKKLVIMREGETFSRRQMEITSDAITATLGNIGYAFAQVNPVPEVNRDARTIAITLQVNPGPRVMVRRINLRGNTRTSDEVIRRELRQFEASWYSQAAIDRSKVRLQRLGFFESGSVEVETVPVQGSPDQVDLVFSVKETQSGQFQFGLGYSQLAGLTTSIQLSQNNFLGTGNRVSVEASRNTYLKRYSFSYLNPYFTDNGLSLGYNLWWREFDNSNFNTAAYSTTSGAAQLVLGLPITENDTISAVFGIDRNQINAYPGYTPYPIIDYIDALNRRTFNSWRTELAWARDTRNDYFAPTRGTYQRISLEATLPGSTVEYYKFNYEFSRYWPLHRHLVLNTRAELGYGDAYSDPVTRNICWVAPTVANPNPAITPVDQCTPASSDYIKTVTADGLPFFENYYAGGTRSVRGFRDNTLGPRIALLPGMPQYQPIGGAIKTTGSIEAIFPNLIKSPSARASAFIDFGNVYADRDTFSTSEFRASAGLALLWRAPVGPISISYAIPLRKRDAVYNADGSLFRQGDEVERLQFTFGGAF